MVYKTTNSPTLYNAGYQSVLLRTQADALTVKDDARRNSLDRATPYSQK